MRIVDIVYIGVLTAAPVFLQMSQPNVVCTIMMRLTKDHSQSTVYGVLIVFMRNNDIAVVVRV